MTLENAAHYFWGAGAEGWRMADTPELSVIRETMPPASSEQLHFHEKAQQFFYIVNGSATFEMETGVVIVEKGEGVHISPGKKHRIINHTEGTIEFLVISQPSTKEDRINCEGF